MRKQKVILFIKNIRIFLIVIYFADYFLIKILNNSLSNSFHGIKVTNLL